MNVEYSRLTGRQDERAVALGPKRMSRGITSD